ncbi:MAG: F0F1 ATP synthase subunit delta [Pseudomonadota bacterium]|nr:F0F1 ATP synthase subunit delta [Gammaproteobacteria bacterium]MBU1559121.1 F0F1 ATP synthase subunit delta [Gammaproteobacteria bacterium]MBU1629329.1 F0F1 ATP synthase subunit delta [Gammaproteobacteria bacterium]MBU1927225.1 F0F1 ATP synthase subunit delta [Gammaproteobacteria bacterium]MBU2546482.1 F0F1 ATP synthase subunit delta [Gammaproteobacteria bacterium]
MKLLQKRTIARPYAQAAFDVALQKNALDQWGDFLETAAQIVSDKQVKKFLMNPSLQEEKVLPFFASILEEMDKEQSGFLRVLFSNNRLIFLPTIFKMFVENRKASENEMDVEIISVFHLSDEQKGKLLNVLKEKLNKNICPTYTIDRNILGGVVIKAGDLVMDGSVQTYLQRLIKSV